jgi:hypothetical protein
MRLSLDPGNPVQLTTDISAQFPAGTPAEIKHIGDHQLTLVSRATGDVFTVPKVRVSVFHPSYPEIKYQFLQFPVLPRSLTVPSKIIEGKTWGVTIDGLSLADTNDLGNILSRMRTFDDFRFVNLDSALRVEGIIHEPTRIYYSKLSGLPLVGSQQWCKNCKNHVETKEFYKHWRECVESVRWCSECNVPIPLEKFAPHMEKHQIVMCIDCGQAIEWRHWENHRLACTPMLREITTDNEFLPEHTRKVSLEMGLDKRDLHTMKSVTRDKLPKSRLAVTKKRLR